MMSTKKETPGSAYQRGYEAGRRRVQRDEHTAVRNRIYESLLPVALQVENWTCGGTLITSASDRVKLASNWADEAMKWWIK